MVCGVFVYTVLQFLRVGKEIVNLSSEKILDKELSAINLNSTQYDMGFGLIGEVGQLIELDERVGTWKVT
jgi:hypothetical protein